MNQENKVVKISDVIENQIPEFILAENPNFVEFLKQYYISQEFQGSTIDISENLVSYKNLDSFDSKNLISETTLTSSVDFFDDVINVESTNGWPQEYGLLKIDDEIITYTGITSTSFTGCIRGFSGISSLTQKDNPEFLVFSQSESSEHAELSVVHNLSNLFLKEFFEKIKYQFTPGFENRDFDPQINPQNFISKANTFYKTKGTDEAFGILFKVLYAEDVKIIKPDDYCFTPSDDKWRVVESFICQLVSGDPFKLDGQTLYQDQFPEYSIENASGSIYRVESFSIDRKNFYKLQIFSGYSSNLNPKGSIEGTFNPTPKTFTTDDIISGSTTVTVDSTVGFGNSGKLEIGNLIVTYTDKTNNQFLNCSGIIANIQKKTEIFSDHFVYSYEQNTDNKVIFKLCNVLSGIESTDALYAYDGDPIQIDRLGSAEESVFLNSLVYNIPISVSCGYAVTSLTSNIRSNQKEGFSINSGSALSKYPHRLKNGDFVDLIVENTNELIAQNLGVNVLSLNEFTVSINSIQNITSLLNRKILFRRKLNKSPFKNLNLTSDVQDSYVDEDSYYITSNGLPNYQINPLEYGNQFNTSSNNILTTPTTHYFNTGDEVTVETYGVNANFANNVGIMTGNSYYVTRINGRQIFLSQSRDNIRSRSYVSLIEYNSRGIETSRINSVNLIPSSTYGQTFNSSKLFKKIKKKSELSVIKKKTEPGNIGVFVNGIELRNYKSFDKIYYGPIESVTVLNSGYDYNLTNPPRFNIENQFQNTEIIPQLKGNSIELSVTDPGFDYIEIPTVRVVGGNNDTVVTNVKLKNTIHEVEFNSTTKDTIIDTVNSKFIFDERHRFVTGEPVIYKTFESRPIGIGTQVSDGFLVNDEVYYVVNVGAGTSMYLAPTKKDAFAGSNLINLRTYGGGLQKFISTIPKKIIDEVTIIQNEKDFEYKKLSFISSDVNLQDNIITLPNHKFENGEEVLYSWTPAVGFNGANIQGLVVGQYYYIVKVDDNRIKLSTTKDGNSIVDLITKEDYTIYFLEYSPIRVEIFGTLTTSGISDIGYNASIVPIVKGKVTDAYPKKIPLAINEDFGDPTIINYELDPKINVVEGQGALLQPLVVNGVINQVVVKSGGSGYFNSVELLVKGSGFSAKLQPVISQGVIVSVNIINGGIGYDPASTTIEVSPIGRNVKLKANIKSWHINDVERNGLEVVEDGLILGKNYSYSDNTYGVYFLNRKLRNFLNVPNSASQHSSIVGWSYDGCPIYGPFAYKNADGSGGIVRMKSGYIYEKTISSPFRLVEEYKFTNSGTLDKYNGRYCITPEFPNGIYAYFCTIDDNSVSQFPYAIGPEYNYEPIEENFNLKNNQTLDFNTLNIVKWTVPYRVEDTQTKYEYFEFFESANGKDLIVEKTSDGTVDQIKILDGGINYKVNDSIVFDNDETFGFGAIAKVSSVTGVAVTTLQTQSKTLTNVEFTTDGTTVVGIASTYHSFENGSFVSISGISTSTYEDIAGFVKINVSDITATLTNSVGPSSITGIVTSIQSSQSLSLFEIDSQIKIDSEILKVVGADKKNNLLNVLRETNSPSHSSSSTITLLQNKFRFTSPKSTQSSLIKNDSYYFNSSESVSIGSVIGVGLGNTLSIYPLGPGIPYTKYVQIGGIYLPNNNFNSGDKIRYVSGDSTIVTNYGNLTSLSDLYVIKLEDDVVGIVTNKSHISDPEKILTYTSTGTGRLHKFTTERNVIVGNVLENNCTITTLEKHNLSSGDEIKLNVTSGITTTFIVTYSNNRVLLNSQINPKIDLYYNDVVIFDLSDASLSGRTFGVYTDENFLNSYIGNGDNGIEVESTSTQLKLQISDFTPPDLYYTLSDTISDENVVNYNRIKINTSNYNSQSLIGSTTNFTFTFNLKSIPERLSYNIVSSTISYDVLNEGPLGSISKIDLISKGSGYRKLPQIITVDSNNGAGFSVFADSSTIGKIEKLKVNNTKFICPSDKTLKPESQVFSAVKLVDNYSVKSLNITYTGKNYIFAPKIKLYNPVDDKIIENFTAAPILKNNSIEDVILINPGFGLKSSDNQIVVTDNTNGFRILNATVSGSSPYEVTLTLQTPSVGFSTSNPLLIEEGDEIFVEGISFIGNGFNSSNYKYKPFVVTFVDPAYGSQDAAVIRYEMDTNPGSFLQSESYNSYATPISYIPKIETTLQKNVFFNEETVNNSEIIDNLNNEQITSLLKLKNDNKIKVGDTLTGSSSKSKGNVLEISKFNTKFTSDYSVEEIFGGSENRGYLSTNIQKLSDNDYYQKFSYSLKSKQQFENWDSAVSDTSHISGYKKFSDLSVESEVQNPSQITTESVASINVVLDSYGDINTISDYDLVNEIDLEDNGGEYTELLKFGRLKFGGSLVSTDNRVLKIDDISSLFNTNQISPKVNLDNVLSGDSNILKYQFYLTSTKSFFGEFIYPEVFELLLTRDEDTLNLTQYSNFYDPFNPVGNPYLGSFSAEINPEDSDEINLYFTPKTPFITVDIKAIKESAPNTVGIATTSFGFVKNVETCQNYPSGSGTQVFYTIPELDCNSGTLIVGISSSTNSIKDSFELSFVNTENDLYISRYTENSIQTLGDVDIVKNGLDIEFRFIPPVGIGVTLQANLKLLTNTYAGFDSITKSISKLSSSQVSTSSTVTGISTVSGIYGYTKYILGIEQTTGITTQRSLVQINSIHAGDYLNNIVYDMNGNIDLNDLNFVTTYNTIGNNYTLSFESITSANYKIIIYESSLLSPNQ
jgi:hypothetical protein